MQHFLNFLVNFNFILPPTVLNNKNKTLRNEFCEEIPIFCLFNHNKHIHTIFFIMEQVTIINLNKI